MIPYIREIKEGTRVQSFCSGCLRNGTKEPLVPYQNSKNKLICRICGSISTDNKFQCYACQRSATLIVCIKGQLEDTLNMTYYCEPCFINIVTEWK